MSPDTPIIFLDFDGVLNHPGTKERNPLWTKVVGICPERTARLNKIIDQTAAKVIISSTWRYYFEPLELDKILKDAGFRGKTIGQTDKFFSHRARGHEVLSEVRERGLVNWVALDDDVAGFDNHPRLVRTYWTEDGGLQDSHVDLAVAILKGDGT